MAVMQSLGWLIQENPDVSTDVFVTDSISVLRQNGCLPHEWREVLHDLYDKFLAFVYVPGHAGVQYHENSDRFAAVAEPKVTFLRILHSCARSQHA